MMGLDFSKIPMDLILNILNIVLLFIITKSLLYKPIRKFMDAREQRIAAEIGKAKEIEEQANQVKAEYDTRLAESKAESARLLADSEKKAFEAAEQIISGATQKSQDILSHAQQTVDAEREKALEEMRADVVDLAVDISEKMLGREINDADNRKIAEEYFAKGHV